MVSRAELRLQRLATGTTRWTESNLAILLAVGLAGAFVSWLLPVPPRSVSSLRITNGGAYDVGVRVTNADHDRWLGLATVPHGSTAVVSEIIDQGDVWTFEFAAQGRTAGEITIPRSELERGRWTMAIPSSVDDTLRQDGAPAPP